MTREDILEQMTLNFKQDRNRLLDYIDMRMLTNDDYEDKTDELKAIKTEWKNAPEVYENFPEMAYPLPLPEWFPVFAFTGSWDENHVETTLADFDCELTEE